MRFEFATATRIIFGTGTLSEVGPVAVQLVSEGEPRALVVTGLTRDRSGPPFAVLSREGVGCLTFPIDGEPTMDTVRQGTEQARQARCNLVVAIGGGSAIDAGKAIAAMCTNPGTLMDYLEIIGQGQELTQQPLPLIALPTTAGTGAEVTRNAVLASPEHEVKVSLRSPLLLPRVAIVDPILTMTVPPDVTATTGLDALTQLLEAFVSSRATPLTDGFCREGLRRAARSLQHACEDGNNLEARTDMALASLLSGLALANAGLGAAHGFAGPIGGMFDAPHGAVCAALLPHVIRINIRALKERSPGGEALRRFDEAARILTDNDQATAADGVHRVTELAEALRIPSLSTYGVTPAHADVLVDKSSQSSSMKGNPISLSHDELAEILSAAI